MVKKTTKKTAPKKKIAKSVGASITDHVKGGKIARVNCKKSTKKTAPPGKKCPTKKQPLIKQKPPLTAQQKKDKKKKEEEKKKKQQQKKKKSST